MKKGVVFIVSAPSGAGKTSLLKDIITEDHHLYLAVSHTTRSPRAGEIDHEHYHFVGHAEFERMIDQEQFLEYAKVHENFYGTSLSAIQGKLDIGLDVILEIDVQGAIQAKEKIAESVLIFIFPPSFKLLEERLRFRKTENEKNIALRLDNAKQEVKKAHFFDYFVINDDFNTAKSNLKSIIQCQRLAAVRNKDILDYYVIN